MIVATLMCGRCRDEHRRQPSKLGTVERNRFGDLVWYGYVSATIWPHSWISPIEWLRGNLTRREARQLREPRVLSSPEIVKRTGADVPLPERLPAFCRTHGPCSVATSDVVGNRGRVYLDIDRPPS